MRHLALISGITLALLVPVAAMAEDTVNLKVTGTISPAVCGVSLGSGSTVQLGTVKLSDFKPGEDLQLADKDAMLTITCEGASAQFRLRATDPHGNSGDESAEYSLGYNEQGGERRSNGYFELSIDAASMASNKFVLKSTDDGLGQAWKSVGSTRVPFEHDGEAFAFAATAGATEPASLDTLSVPLKIKAVLAKDPVVNEDVALAGQATIEILY
jgi:hypothetical protein